MAGPCSDVGPGAPAVLILAGTLLAVLLVPVLGGRLSGLSTIQLRARLLIVGALLLQVLVITVVPHWPHLLLVVAHGVSYVLAGLFVWINRRVPGLWLIALGGGLNAFVIALNGGTMPASAQALRRAGLEAEVEGYANSEVVRDPVLPWLGDVFASPTWLPLQNVYSAGDLLLLAGAVWAVHRSCGTVLARWPRRRPVDAPG